MWVIIIHTGLRWRLLKWVYLSVELPVLCSHLNTSPAPRVHHQVLLQSLSSSPQEGQEQPVHATRVFLTLNDFRKVVLVPSQCCSEKFACVAVIPSSISAVKTEIRWLLTQTATQSAFESWHITQCAQSMSLSFIALAVKLCLSINGPFAVQTAAMRPRSAARC